MTMNPRPKRWPAGGRRWRRAVVATYAQTGSLEAAATAAGTSRRTVCRARDEDPGFAAELEEAMEIYADALEAECDRRAFSGKGMIFSGIYPKRDLVEMVEIAAHPFFIAVQSHPEFKSKPDRPHPLFREFIRSALKFGI